LTDYYVAFWNLENLFDVNQSPRRTDKLQRTIGNELKGWTKKILDKKIKQLASVIKQMNQNKGPDLMGACEIENDFVLERLVNALNIPNRNYAIAHHNMSDNRGIDVGFIYDKALLKAEKQFSHFIVKRYATRDLFQVNFSTKLGRRLVVIGNHWPSRSAGQYESEPYRIVAAETIAYWHQRIREELGKDTAVLAMGDFNDEPFNRSLANYALAMRSRTEVTRARSPKFLNLMWPIMGEGKGTHYYGGEPNFLDQFLASKGLVTGNSKLRVLPEKVEVIKFPGMAAKNGAPIRFGKGQKPNIKGFSDHFPIGVVVRET
jgi:predicted extracellular nuclease